MADRGSGDWEARQPLLSVGRTAGAAPRLTHATRPSYPTLSGYNTRGAAANPAETSDSALLLSGATKSDLYHKEIVNYHSKFSVSITVLYGCMVASVFSLVVLATLSAIAAGWNITATGEGPGFLAGVFAAVPAIILVQGTGYTPWYLYAHQRALNIGMMATSALLLAAYGAFETWFLFGWCAAGSAPRYESIIIDQTCENQIAVVWVAMLGGWWLFAWSFIALVTIWDLFFKVANYTADYKKLVKSEEDKRLFAEEIAKLNAGKFGPDDPGMVLDSFQVRVRFSAPKQFA